MIGRKLIERRTNLHLERLEDRWLLAGDITLVRHFDTWDAGVIRSTDVAGLTYHPPSGHLFLADSEINELPAIFTGDNMFETSLLGDQVFREIASNNNEPTGIAYNEFDGFFYVTNDNNKKITRYDDNLDTPLLEHLTISDLANALDPEGITADPATGLLYVIDGNLGGMQVLTYDSNLVFQSSFSVAAQMQDAEGIAFHPDTGNLYVVSSADKKIFEYSSSGTFVQDFDISGFSPSPDEPQGLAFGPTSDPTDDPAALALYIADAMVDNQPDGRIFETTISVATNNPPTVDAGTDHSVTGSLPASVFLDGTVTDDGEPSGTLNTAWSQVSGPGSVSFGNPQLVDTTATFSDAGQYVLRLVADDGQYISSDELTVLVNGGILEKRVNATADDAEERANGSVLLNSSDLELVADGGGNQVVGMRFTDITIPPGATVLNAYVQFKVDEATSVPTTLTIKGDASDDASPFLSQNGNISSRTSSNASVSWSPPAWLSGQAGINQRTPDISNVVQEIVNRPGWVSSNALAIIISGTGERVAESFNGDPFGAPLLHVEYTNGSATNLSPILGAIGDRTVTEGDTLSFTATASDQDNPPDALTFSLDSGAPTAVSIDPISGVFSWQTSEGDGPGVYSITVRVTDDGSPPLSDAETITVTVDDASGGTVTVERRISTSSDDAEERATGSVLLNSSDLEMVADGGGNQTVGLRFTNVDVPPGATVVGAYIQFQADEKTSVSTNLSIQGQATDNPLTFLSSNANITSRPRTIAAVPWSPAAWNVTGAAGAEQQTTDISSVIQEIVDLPAWAIGNAMAIIIDGTGERVAEAYNGVPAAAPLLHIEYLAAPQAAVLPLANVNGDDRGAPLEVLAMSTSPRFSVGDHERLSTVSAVDAVLRAYPKTARQFSQSIFRFNRKPQSTRAGIMSASSQVSWQTSPPKDVGILDDFFARGLRS